MGVAKSGGLRVPLHLADAPEEGCGHEEQEDDHNEGTTHRWSVNFEDMESSRLVDFASLSLGL